MISPFSCNRFRAGRLPCLHHIVERPDRNSTNRPRNFSSSALKLCFAPGNLNIRVAGYSTPRPQAQRSRKGFVHRFLGKIKITEQADQSCQDSSRIHAIKGVEQFAYLLGGRLGHDDDSSKPATPNQFGKRRIDAKCPGRDSEIWTTERFLGSTLAARKPVIPLF